MFASAPSSIASTESQERPVLDSKLRRMLALIDNVTDVSEIAREIAVWVLAGDDRDDPLDADLSSAMNDEDDVAYLKALVRRWPDATGDDVSCGYDLAIAVAKVSQSWGSASWYARATR